MKDSIGWITFRELVTHQLGSGSRLILRESLKIVPLCIDKTILINEKGDGEDPEVEEAERQRLMGLAMSL